MNAIRSSNRPLLLLILGLSFGLHAIALALLILFGLLQPVAPVEDTTITMIRLGSQGGRGGKPRASRPSDSSTVSPPASSAPKPSPQPPATAARPASSVPPTPQPTAAKPKPVQPNPEAQGPRVATSTSKKKPANSSNAATPPAASSGNSPSPNDAKIANALNQVKQDLKNREASSNGGEGGSGDSAGGGTSGNSNGAAGGNIAATDPVLVQYQTQVKQRIIREWIRANAGDESEVFRTRVAVRIDAAGRVVSTSFVKKSGNASFDLSAIRAIERASPLPTPPESIRAEALSEGFVVDFNSRMLGG